MSPVYEKPKSSNVWWYILGGCGGCVVIYVLFSLGMAFVFTRAVTHGQGSLSQVAESAECMNHLQEINFALKMYSADNKGYLPRADRWTDALDATGNGYVTRPTVFHCPVDQNQFSYTMNVKYSGKKLEEVTKQGKEPLVYESKTGTANASDAVTSLPNPGRHQGKNNILCADGTVESR